MLGSGCEFVEDYGEVREEKRDLSRKILYCIDSAQRVAKRIDRVGITRPYTYKIEFAVRFHKLVFQMLWLASLASLSPMLRKTGTCRLVSRIFTTQKLVSRAQIHVTVCFIHP
jgi:hypothetical protein